MVSHGALPRSTRLISPCETPGREPDGRLAQPEAEATVAKLGADLPPEPIAGSERTITVPFMNAHRVLLVIRADEGTGGPRGLGVLVARAARSGRGTDPGPSAPGTSSSENASRFDLGDHRSYPASGHAPPARAGRTRRIEGLTASEFAFLALGLILGVASGAALVTVFRSRPPAPREIKVTVMPDSVPRRRATTLAEDAFTTEPPEPARGGPADRRHIDRSSGPGTRTPVRSGPLPPAGAGDPDSGLSFRPVLAAMTQGGASFLAPRYGSVRLGSGSGPSAVGVRVHDETDWTLEGLRIAARRTAERQIREGRMIGTAILEMPPSEPVPAREQGSVVSAGTSANQQSGTMMSGDPERPRATDTSAPAAASPADPSAASQPDDGCGDARRIAEERCTLATRAREQAEFGARDAARCPAVVRRSPEPR